MKAKRQKHAKFESKFLGRKIRLGLHDIVLEGRLLSVIMEPEEAYFYELELENQTLYVSVMDVSWIELREKLPRESEAKLRAVRLEGC